jgi:hypothetical protein
MNLDLTFPGVHDPMGSIRRDVFGNHPDIGDTVHRDDTLTEWARKHVGPFDVYLAHGIGINRHCIMVALANDQRFAIGHISDQERGNVVRVEDLFMGTIRYCAHYIEHRRTG